MSCVKSWIGVAMLATIATGCATAPSGAARTPGEPTSLAGTWSGTFMGPELSSAAGLVEPPARLTIEPDGGWTLSGSGAVATGRSRRVGNKIALDGTVTSGDPTAV